MAHHIDLNDDNKENLDVVQSELFHSTVSKLSYLSKRSRPHIETAVDFLCTRFNKCNIDDYKN